MGNYTITDNTIQTSNGVGGITLGIFGADGADPPSFVTREWLFANTGILTTPSGLSVTSGNVSATGAVLSGNATVGNLHVSRNIYAQAISTSAGITGYAITSNNTITATGNATVGGILTDNYYFANGDPFISSNYNDSSVVNLLSDFGSNSISTTGNITASNFEGNITTTGNITAANFEGNITITGNVTGTSANVELVAGEYTWAFDNTGNLSLPGNTFAVNYANGSVVSLSGGGGIADIISDTTPQLGGNLDLNQFEINGLGNINISGFMRLTGSGNELLLSQNSISTGSSNSDLILTPSDANVWIQMPSTTNEESSGLQISHENENTGLIELKSGQSYTRWYANAVLEVNGNINSGNISAENATVTNLIGNDISLSGNITGSSANVTITANSFVTTFDTAGTATFPGAVQLAVYANTTVRDASISNPVPGMMIYVTGTGMQVRGDTQWNTISGSGT